MKNDLSIRISGEAGQGLKTIGITLTQIFDKAGLNIFANQDYMSRIRGGNNYFQIRISNKPLHTLRDKVDIIVALDKASIDIHKIDLNEKGIIIADLDKFQLNDNKKIFFNSPIYKLAQKHGGKDIYSNSVAVGILANITGIDLEFVKDILKKSFQEKNEEIINKNIDCLVSGYEYSKNNFKDDRFKFKLNKDSLKRIIINGNKAIGLGAIKAGCKFYSAYPMTPSTSIMDTIAYYSNYYNIIVEQAEDEIAAINMIIGASFAGVRAMTSTSGGGFALMQEGISLSGMTETPIVIVDAQRPAPATGLPTRTEQSDLDFVIHAGHGDFVKVVFAPGTIEEAFYLTIKAFNIAEEYQIPVIILTDQHLADSYRNIEEFDMNKIKVKKFIISKEKSKTVKNYKRYKLTESGISPQAVPSWINDVIYCDSDEHTEEGHITEDSEIRNKMIEKRFFKKINKLIEEIEPPVFYNVNKAKIILIGFGSTYGVLKETCDNFKDHNIGMIHLPQVLPFPAKEVIKTIKYLGTELKFIYTVENNAGAQLAKLIRKETGIVVNDSILKYDGRPFNLDYLIEEINKRSISK
jgi:2-oxoglutarate ferredoxin oxidoreductase subunit alpha